MKIQINEVSNGFILDIEQENTGMTKCYRYVDVLSMLEDIGKIVNGGKKVQVIEK
jgi:hypothetical protein